MKIYINILPNKNPIIPGELSKKFPILDSKLIELWTLNMISNKNHVFKLGVNQQVSIDSNTEVFNCICQKVDSKNNYQIDTIALGICLEQAIIKLQDRNTIIYIHDKYKEDVIPVLNILKLLNNTTFINSY